MADREAVAHRAGAAADRIVFLGHATVLAQLDGVRVLTDPLLRHRVAHLRRRVAPIADGAVDGVDAVLISHLHHDHLDLASLRLLGTATPLIVPAGAGAWLRDRGFADVTELAAGQRTHVGPLQIAAVPARHQARRVLGPRAQPVGYVLSGARSVYFAGDTELFEQMREIPAAAAAAADARGAGDTDEAGTGDPSRLDVALLPVAGWGPTLGPGHMGSLDAARAAALLAPRVAIPIHWGTLWPIAALVRGPGPSGDPPLAFARHVAELAPDVDVRILAPGQETRP